MITDDQRDELIFDYLEGNLSAEEQEVFRILNDESELFNREVRLWQNTYQSEPLPSIGLLEEKLLIKNEPTHDVVVRIGVALVLMLSFTEPQFVTVNEQAVQSIQKRDNLAPSLSVDVVHDELECTSEVVQTKAFASREITRKHPTEVFAAVSDVKLKISFVVESIRPPLSITAAIVSVPASDSPASNANPERKKWSRRESRLIRKQRWQNSELRKASEFQKGKVPYVVPLNSNNF